LHNIHYLRDAKGRSDVEDYLRELSVKRDKDSRIKLNKIHEYIEALSEYGTAIGLPKVKHLTGELWELRPLRDRIIFVAWIDNSFVLLHHFMKTTQKTPSREIEQAKRELAYLKERGLYDEEN